MVWDRVAVKMAGKSAFRRNYGSCVLVSLITALLSGSSSITRNFEEQDITLDMPWGLVITLSMAVLLLGIFVVNVLLVGAHRFFVENRDYNAPASKILFGFQGAHYGNVSLTMFLMNLKIFLWSLLLVIPGVIKTYEYRMVPYILAEQPDIPQADAFAISREMMMNQKFEAWFMDLTFLGWHLLTVFTCGLVGIFWTAPYQNAANAELYAALRDHWMHTHGYSQQETTGESF